MIREAVLYKKLIERYTERKLSSEELEVFYHLLDEGKLDSYLLEAMDRDIAELPDQPKPQLSRFSWSKITKLSIAACILMAVGAVFFVRKSAQSPEASALVQDKAPGAEKAMLILGSGETIDLNNAPDGQLRASANVNIIKNKDGRISYTNKEDKQDASDTNNAQNTIKVPRGGHYEVSLADGTKVFLNAFSSLTFPSVFTGRERIVKLTGEAYFEVTPSSRAGGKAFVVETGTQKVQVVGTSFNVNAYTDEPYTKTTLVQGKVNVLTSGGITKLVPGQQSSMNSKGTATVIEIDPETALDWKNGDFIFVNESLKSVMRKLSRWYDMDVVYEKGISDETLSGQISRDKKLSEVLHLLSLSGDFNYKLNNNVLYLYPSSKVIK